MADSAAAQPSFFDSFLTYSQKAASVYNSVKLAEKGVAPTVIYETNGKGDPVIAQGAPAAVAGKDPFADAINNATNKVAMAYAAKQASDSMPYVVGLVALGITIFLLTKKG